MTDWGGLLDGMTAIVRDTFGEPAPIIYTRGEDDSVHSIRAVFDYEHEPLEAGGSVPTTARIPVLDVRNDDLGFEPLPDDRVVIEGHGEFRVIDTYPASSKTTKLHLRKV